MKDFLESLKIKTQESPDLAPDTKDVFARLLGSIILVVKQRNSLCEYKTQIDEFDEQLMQAMKGVKLWEN